MTEALQSLLAWINAHPNWALWLLFAITFCDSLFIVGAFVPAALPLFAIGALVALGALELWPTLLLAAAGALVGDTLSFWLGHRYGERLFQARFFLRHPEIVVRARRFFERYGPYSVLLARFLGPLRAVTPALSAAAGMPYWKFLLADGIGACAWACAFIVPGVVFGASLGLAAEVAGRLASLLLALLVGLWLALWLTVVITRRTSALASVWIPRLLAWSQQRRAAGRHGLALIDDELPESPALAVLAVLLLAIGAGLLYLVAGVHLHHYPMRIDGAVFQWLRDLHTPWGLSLARRLLQMGEWPVYVPVAAVVFVSLLALRKPRAAAHWLAALAFGGAITAGLYATPLLQPPYHYFDAGAPLAARSRDLILATIIYGFLPVLLASGRSPSLRTLLYGISSLLLLLLLFAHLYLGLQWFSVAMLLVLFGLVWVALLGLGYRLHHPDMVRTRWVALPVALSFVVALAWRWQQLDIPPPRPPPHYQTITEADWRNAPARPRFPTQRQDAAGRLRQPFTVQWAGALSDIDARLRAAGWQEPAPLAATQMLHWLTNSTAVGELPVLPQVHAGEHPALMLRRPIDETHQYFIRLWPSHYRLDDGRPIWVGNVSLQEARSFHRLLRYPVATDFDPPLADLVAALPDTEHRQVASVWLLW
ncbi:VTT domain-containing protein [Solimonas soli]|uniref:VTT domain-containing protein n=1 Tax=Solimonas soli TaxID=413479 RepID=UPI000487E7AC|nr:VTT domain-containing protein [Solimonas soli]